jgi:tetratricopeptide (TPR) repeat protein
LAPRAAAPLIGAWLQFALRLAHAEAEPPDYAATLTEGAGAEVARVGREQGAEAAQALAKRWMRTFGASARVEYELGLAWRLAGDDPRARSHLDTAVSLDPDLAAARYDRGEVRLASGDLSGAREDFEAVARLQPEAWPGWFRLAEIDGREGDAGSFERNLLRALRCGFSVQAVAQDPTWRGLVSHADVGPVLVRLVRVYQGDAVLEAIGAGAGPVGDERPAER